MARTLRRRRCRTCHTWTLVGLDNDVCALIATINPSPLSPAGEALARLDGLATYHLRHDRGGELELFKRDRWQISGNPAGDHDRLHPADIVSDHRCGTEYPTTKSVLTNSRPAYSGAANELPPF